ncbi:MAG TPA: class I SAM-dependent RNA methyltransferase [Firmicutes bacterium]|nr:class I SAM-dependent RNA methyltransferase [Bacillota bacterium]
MEHIELIATAAFGLEAVVARELKELGYEDLRIENGKVTFVADKAAICRGNLWLRTADRLLLKMGQFRATSFEELFQGTKALAWPEWLPKNACFPVEGKSVRSTLYSVPDCQAIVKKAIVEKMKEKYHLNWFPEDGPRYTVEVALLKDVATLTIDTSGAGLHKRGYRKLVGEAPLRETLAAAMVLLSHWKSTQILCDPFCGSGTIPIEAALIGRNIPPGLKRSFAAEKWPNIATVEWQRAREEAYDLARFNEPLDIRGTDIDPAVLSLARYHFNQAGIQDGIHWQRQDFRDFSNRYKYGYIITNPPYGHRLGEIKEAEQIYKDLRPILAPLDTWSYFILTSHKDFERLFGRQATKRRKLYNGRIECHYYQYFGPRPPRQDQ